MAKSNQAEAVVTAAPVDVLADPSAAVANLARVEREFSLRLLAAQAELRTAHTDAGADLLNAALSGQVGTANAGRPAELQAEITQLESAIAKARADRLAAIPGVWNRKTQGLRAEAKALKSEVAIREEKTAALIDALRDHEGVTYVPGPDPQYTKGLPLVRLLAFGVDAAPTQTQQLQARIAALEGEAAILQARQVPQNGGVGGSSASELFDAVLGEPLRLGPTLATITAWVEATEAKARSEWTVERRSEHLSTDDSAWAAVSRTFTLAWHHADVIAAERSELRLYEREEPHDHTESGGGILV